MNALEYTSHAAPIDGDASAGPNLEYDESFTELGRYLIPKTASMVTTDEDVEEVKVDWKPATELAESLITKTRDIRVAVNLGRCAVETKGLVGLSSAIELVKLLLENMWLDVHPAPEAEDDMDMMMRFNALSGLVDPALVAALRSATLATSVAKMPVSLNTIDMAIGKRPASSDDERTQSSGLVDEVFAAEDVSGLVAVKSQADQAKSALAEIVTIWRNEMKALSASREAEGLRFEFIEAPQFDALVNVFSDIGRHIAERLPELVEDDADVEGGTKVASQNITTRADAAMAITRIMEWFQHNEPSSPVPIMLERARSMISKSFLEIVADLGEGGIAEARKTTGQSSESED